MAVDYRSPSGADLPGMVRLFNASRRGLPFERESTSEEIAAYTLRDPDFDPRGALVAVDDKEIVGYCDCIVDKARLAIGKRDAQIRFEVQPSWRDEGIGMELITRILKFMKKRGLESAQFWCYEGDVWRRNLGASLGFKSVHRYFSMIRKSGDTPPPIPKMPGLRLEHRMAREASTEELARWLDVTNESFSELFNYSPWTLDRVTNMFGSAEEIMRLTYAYLDDELVGVSLSEDSAPYNKEHGLHDGWINTIAVRRNYRKRGIGRILMLDGMHWLLERQLPVMHLGVDADNRKALGLYESLGFEVLLENGIYMRQL